MPVKKEIIMMGDIQIQVLTKVLEPQVVGVRIKIRRSRVLRVIAEKVIETLIE